MRHRHPIGAGTQQTPRRGYTSPLQPATPNPTAGAASLPAEPTSCAEERCTSHRAFAERKVRWHGHATHGHTIDACSPRRPAAATPSPAKCSSNAAFTDNKWRHRHGIDQCSPPRAAGGRGSGHEHGGHEHGGSSHQHGQCRSNRDYEEAKRLCLHGVDECSPPRERVPKSALSCSDGHGPRCASHADFTEEKHHHRHGIDQCSPRRAAAAAPEQAGVGGSNAALAGRKQRHRHAIDGPTPRPVKTSHGRCQSHQGYEYTKARHQHAVDECSPPRAHGAAQPEHPAPGSPRCSSHERYSEAKRLCLYSTDQWQQVSQRA